MAECDVKINYGVKTGCNDAFIIDGATKDRLIAEDPKSAEIIRPILRGRDIKRYSCEFNNWWLISTFPAKGYDINDYLAIKKFLLGLRPKIDQNGQSRGIPVSSRSVIMKRETATNSSGDALLLLDLPGMALSSFAPGNAVAHHLFLELAAFDRTAPSRSGEHP